MEPEGGSERFGASVAPLSDTFGMHGLGVMAITVPPGKRAFPFHNHLGNDELFVILEGTGSYRVGSETVPIKRGDVCAAPRGGPDTAHQIINSGDVPLRYVGISTRQDPDVVEYPDSGKFAAMAVWPGKNFISAHLKFVGRKDDSGDYWDGEDT